MCRLIIMCHDPLQNNMARTDTSINVLFKAYVVLNHLFHHETWNIVSFKVLFCATIYREIFIIKSV